MKIIFRAVLLATVLAGAPALAGPIMGAPPGSRPPPLPEDQWILTLIMPTGEINKFGGFPTQKACEAAIPKYEKEQHGYNGHCDPNKPLK